MSGSRILVAGIGNVFLGDDGFGVEALRQLSAYELPDHAEAVDFGVRGVHLAYQLLDGYDTLVLVDATARGGAPGTLYLIEPNEPNELNEPNGWDGRDGPDAPDGSGRIAPAAPVLDGHQMSPDAVLALLHSLCEGTGTTPPRRILVVGCEPASLEEGIGLSEPVAAAVPEAVRMILDLLRNGHAEPAGHADDTGRDTVAAPVAELRRTP
ncbi:hydrogenase maturation protease [Streptomyces sp. NBC_00503]|uniref:hydrogenase maturation protease n=1 Tax=Streptomyces sp. NBC_00503 TaxID=2903659 RepID=UPI002E808DAD|nr:hydrogenase maturation protease [Streptomyces sp. NBC_00503]WUD79331.1 hydrogenase maturation protease [Streptomyces sp. NBC_00503]